MRPPDFWTAPPDRPRWPSRLLTPLATLYAAGTALRLRRGAPVRVSVPVICVGNLNVGGTGKTPTVIALIERLGAMGKAVHVVSRGYGGRLTGPVRVDERAHSAADVGDEPLMLSAFAPTWVAGDRAAGARQAIADGAEAIVLDDGFQDPAIAKDLSMVVVDAGVGFGNGRVLPAGPLREPVATGLSRADLLLRIGAPDGQDAFDRIWGPRVSVPQLRGRLAPLRTGMDWTGLRVVAFAGIGHPSKFFDTLVREGAEIVETHALDDHQPLGPALLARLDRQASSLNAQLVTTEKDAVRLPQAYRSQVLTLPVRLQFDDPGGLLQQALNRTFR